MYLAVSQLGLYMHVLTTLRHKSKSESSAEFKQPASNKFLRLIQLEGVRSDEINQLIVESLHSFYYLGLRRRSCGLEAPVRIRHEQCQLFAGRIFFYNSCLF